jgi:hypothetical protein
VLYAAGGQSSYDMALALQTFPDTSLTDYCARVPELQTGQKILVFWYSTGMNEPSESSKLAGAPAGGGGTEAVVKFNIGTAISECKAACDAAGVRMVFVLVGDYPRAAAADSNETNAALYRRAMRELAQERSDHVCFGDASTVVSFEELVDTGTSAFSGARYGAVGAVTGTAISSMSGSGTTVTVATSAAHGYQTGQVVDINGATGSYDTNGVTITVTSATGFTFSAATTGATSGGRVVPHNAGSALGQSQPYMANGKTARFSGGTTNGAGVLTATQAGPAPGGVTPTHIRIESGTNVVPGVYAVISGTSGPWTLPDACDTGSGSSVSGVLIDCVHLDENSSFERVAGALLATAATEAYSEVAPYLSGRTTRVGRV